MNNKDRKTQSKKNKNSLNVLSYDKETVYCQLTTQIKLYIPSTKNNENKLLKTTVWADYSGIFFFFAHQVILKPLTIRILKVKVIQSMVHHFTAHQTPLHVLKHEPSIYRTDLGYISTTLANTLIAPGGVSFLKLKIF